MPLTSMPKHGTSNLRSAIGSNHDGASAYKSYLRISFLELERARRQQLLRGAERTIRRIGDRFREIEVEKQSILAALEGQPDTAGSPVCAAQAGRSSRVDRGFRLRY